MPKYTSSDISRIAERLKRARDRKSPAHFLIGAGCSISAGIPGARELIQKIHQEFPAECASLAEDKRHSYGACMALLTINERRDLIRPYLSKAKINWGTIALAQLIAEGFVERVVTVNFDLVLENACGLLGLQPAVYDFGVAPANDPAMIVSPAIVHLHGQSYGLVLLNTDEETEKHREKLEPVLVDTLRNAPLVIVGYSGSADGISNTLLEQFEGRDSLYWAGYSDDLPAHLQGFREKKYFQYLGGADFDRFMIELAQLLGCWPPHLFADPSGHLLRCLSQVVSYPVMDSDSSIDLLADLRRMLESWQPQLSREATKAISFEELYMKGDYEGVVKLFATSEQASLSEADRDIGYWSNIGLGGQFVEQAKVAGDEQAKLLFAEAREKFTAAMRIKPDHYEAAWGLASTLCEQARRVSSEEALRLLALSNEKFAAALAVNPSGHEALSNWANMFCDRAKLVSGDEALLSLKAAGEKYAAAIEAKPDSYHALFNWGALLLRQASSASGEEASRLLTMAAERLEAAAKIDPTDTYNLACVAALRGDELECRNYLETAEKHKKLPSFEHLTVDTDLNSMRCKPWFRELLARKAKAAS